MGFYKELGDRLEQWLKEKIKVVDTKVESIAKYHKYLNTELDYGVFEVQTMKINANTPIIFSSVVSGNMQLSEQGYIKLQAGKTYVFHLNLYVVNLGTGMYLIDSSNNVLTEVTTSGLSSFIYKATDDIDVTFRTQEFSGNDGANISADWSCINVYEINRQIAIDSVEHINKSQGIEDTPVGHIIAHMGTVAPKHYLICDGAEYKVSDYPYLAQHIEDSFGSIGYFGGDGISTFRVPDLRGEFLRGTGTATRNTGAGASVGQHQEPTSLPAEYQYIKNVGSATKTQITYRMDDGNIASDGNYSVKYSDNKVNLKGNVRAINVDGVEGNTTMTFAACTTRPTNTAVLYCIKYEPTYYMQVQNTNYLQPTMCSEEERVIGCWINGKPLYQKTISFGAITVQNIDIPVNIENIEIAMITDGYVYDKVLLSFYPISYTNSLFTQYSNTAFVMVENNVATLSIRKSNEQTISNGYITIQYTKTTDEENSFTNDMIKDFVIQNEVIKEKPYTEEEVINTVNTLW